MHEPICCSITCDGDLTDGLVFDGELSEDLVSDGECGVVQRVSSYDAYDGPYEVQPKFEDQYLKTNGKLMRGDVHVDAIDPNYNDLRNKPSINGVELLGNKTSEDLMLIGEISNAEILTIWNTVMSE